MASTVSMTRRQWLSALGSGSLAAAWLLTEGQAPAAYRERKIEVNRVPPKIKKAANQAVPGATWTGAMKYIEDGEVTYELEGTDRKERNVWVQVEAEDNTKDTDGQVYDVKTEIPLTEVPAVVRKALKAKMPKFQPPETTYEVREEGKVVRYEFEGKQAKKDITVQVSADGKSVEIEAEE
jgi:hypothetical protein